MRLKLAGATKDRQRHQQQSYERECFHFTGADEQPELDSSDQLLTPREIEVLRMIAEGLGNKEIASKLKISDHTVKFHISSIFAKLGASNRAEAVTLGIRLGVIMV